VVHEDNTGTESDLIDSTVEDKSNPILKNAKTHSVSPRASQLMRNLMVVLWSFPHASSRYFLSK